ncbi:MAG TPA: MBL fold metallo-hydrolase [Anaerolineae bacterium]|nr:MBL fold metallo-hydrolase [Anaerolineae bacterium]HQI85153.1 MBL fold metallo-hydrolase [Anaerolineae bacterium]
MTETYCPYIVPLGVAAALADAGYANSYLAVAGRNGYWLVDCADSPIGRLQRAGIDPLTVRGVILTHFHPDHVYGLPAFLLGLFMLADGQPRSEPLTIYARPEVSPLVRDMIGLYTGQSWIAPLALAYHDIPLEVGALVAEDADFTVTAAPTFHSVPSIALRFTRRDNGRAFVYSSDTFPCPEVECLANGAALLFHEATDSDRNHTRPGAAGALATRAGVERLVLIHYHTTPAAMAYALSEAAKTFSGPVELAEEFKLYPW